MPVFLLLTELHPGRTEALEFSSPVKLYSVIRPFKKDNERYWPYSNKSDIIQRLWTHRDCGWSFPNNNPKDGKSPGQNSLELLDYNKGTHAYTNTAREEQNKNLESSRWRGNLGKNRIEKY